ncbi:PREDICTED: uncharacterized protein LOC104588832 isoform X2 [Nelumbo nucifera]|uniref:Uncharacterized protein LOC104588832 isoform X2 n=1 Tax=Nelumbo nucifera TaxID=4432 RepID=A0A1U7YXH2_NELNU|nr:PREDICTED: uncharacterized protein LOC104588832 isoform X2 [Nelumbo nucifera]
MSKESDIWDDSALINAFNNAITKYKIMHKKGYQESSIESEKVINGNMDDAPVITDDCCDAARQLEVDDNNNVTSSSSIGVGEANDFPASQKNHHASSPVLQSNIHATPEGNLNSQGASEYTHLLNQYYELEGQRQQVLQKLHQLGYWNYQNPCEGSGPCGQWFNCFSTSQEPVSACQASYQGFSSCCPYVCHCLAASCPSSTCTSAETCENKFTADVSAATCALGPKKLSPLEDIGVVKTAMTAAERAISSMKMKYPSTYNASEEKEKKEGPSSLDGAVVQPMNSETDLSVVLSAWYSAGFYTARW